MFLSCVVLFYQLPSVTHPSPDSSLTTYKSSFWSFHPYPFYSDELLFPHRFSQFTISRVHSILIFLGDIDRLFSSHTWKLWLQSDHTTSVSHLTSLNSSLTLYPFTSVLTPVPSDFRFSNQLKSEPEQMKMTQKRKNGTV